MEKIKSKIRIAVIGLGYVGLPLAVTFAENSYNVIGFDLNKNKIEKYLSGQDPTNEVGDERIQKCKNIEFTYDLLDIFSNCCSTNTCFRK